MSKKHDSKPSKKPKQKGKQKTKPNIALVDPFEPTTLTFGNKKLIYQIMPEEKLLFTIMNGEGEKKDILLDKDGILTVAATFIDFLADIHSFDYSEKGKELKMIPVKRRGEKG